MSDSSAPTNSSYFHHDSDSGQSAPDDASDIAWHLDEENVRDGESTTSRSTPQTCRSRSRRARPTRIRESSSSDDELSQAQPPPPPARPRPTRAPRSTTTTQDPEFHWDSYDWMDPYSNDWLPPFQQRPGVLVDTSDFGCIDFFSLVFKPAVIDLIVKQTNDYAVRCLHALPETNYYKQRWSDTNKEEMQAFIGLQIAMGLNPKPSLDDYWSSFWLVDIHFRHIMSKHRFKILSAFFHLR